LVDAALLGMVLAVGSAFCFAGNRSFGSGPLKDESSNPVFVNYISLLVGVVIAFVASVATLQLVQLASVSLFALVMFGVAGLFHFGLGRTLSYTSIKHIGANPMSTLVSTQALYSLLLAVLFLQETINVGIVAGTFLILLGILLAEGRLSASKRGGVVKIGYVAALGAGLIFGITPIAIKAGLHDFNFYAAATLISFTAAFLVYSAAVTPGKFMSGLRKTPRSSLISFVVMGVFGILAQLMRYAALALAPVVLVAPMLTMHPVFTLLLTRRFSKENEVFTARMLSSIFVTVSGAVLVGLSSGIG
jgi:drug/metabolite transporter (DMT)-like permease